LPLFRKLLVRVLTEERKDERKEGYSKCLRQEPEARGKRQQNRKNKVGDGQCSPLQPLSSSGDDCFTHTKTEIFRRVDIEFWTVGIEMMDRRTWLKIAGELREFYTMASGAFNKGACLQVRNGGTRNGDAKQVTNISGHSRRRRKSLSGCLHHV
jgi:hypothetical protein